MHAIFKKNIILQTAKVNFGMQRIEIPFFDVISKTSGKTILITAGMDGDEYTGIEAAFRLVDRFSSVPFNGRIIIIPIVNILGFKNKMSSNPLDGKFPKYITRGNGNGTPTERLIEWLHTTFAFKSDIWIDLHGGAANESLIPFVWLYKTNNTILNNQLSDLEKIIHSKWIVIQKSESHWRPYEVAQHTCQYIILESGDRGLVEEKDVVQHIKWVEEVLKLYHVIDGRSVKKNRMKNAIHNVFEIISPMNGLWHPRFVRGDFVKKGQELGSVNFYDTTKKKTINATCSGIILWQSVSLSVQKSETLMAIGGVDWYA